jgi:outer membrane protein OmpA-like peptidoglycan-associated protein
MYNSNCDIQEFHFITDKIIKIIHNTSLRKDMRISRKLYIRSDWRLEWWLLVIAAALVCLAGGSSDAVWGDNKELRVIRVQHEIDLGDRISESAGPDYYISGGESYGLRVSMLLDVYRPLQIYNPFNEKDYDIRILIGQLKVLRVFPDLAIARLQSLEPFATNPIVTYRSVMIGDYILPRPEGAIRPANFSLPSSILFNFASWQLKPEAHKALSTLSRMLKEHKDQDIVIDGHTCNIGSDEHNNTLSLKRAKSVSDFLIHFGGIQKERIQIFGYGEGLPITPNDTEKGRKQNRRVDFRLIAIGTPVPRIDSLRTKNLANPRKGGGGVKGDVGS